MFPLFPSVFLVFYLRHPWVLEVSSLDPFISGSVMFGHATGRGWRRVRWPNFIQIWIFFLLTNHRKIRNVKHALKVTGPIILKPKNPSSRSNLKVTHGISLFSYFLISRVFYFLLEMLSQSQSTVVGRNDFRSSCTASAKTKWFCWDFIVLCCADIVMDTSPHVSSQGGKRRRKLKSCHNVSSRGVKRQRKRIHCHWVSSHWR